MKRHAQSTMSCHTILLLFSFPFSNSSDWWQVVEWAKDAVRLRTSDEESGEELDTDECEGSESSMEEQPKKIKKKPKVLDGSDSSLEEKEKPKKRKSRKRWNFL